MRFIALLLNFICPGLGSLALGKWLTGLIQLAILGVCILSFIYSFHAAYAIGAIAIVWLWGLVTAEWSPHHGGVDRGR